MESRAEYGYIVNGGDIIESVDSQWLAFARANGAPELTESAVVGKSLFDYLDGLETKSLYQIVLDRVRENGTGAQIPFRCDGPTVRRFMELRITPREQGKIEFVGRTIREEERAEVRFFDSTIARAGGNVVVCVLCKRIRVERDVWLEVEEGIARLDLFESLPLPRIINGVCDECEGSVRR